jgi:hypothetical protein
MKDKKKSTDTVFKKAADVIYRKEGNTYNLVKMDNSDFFFKVDQWASECWSLIDGKRSQQKICERIAKESQINMRTVANEVKKLTSQLQKLQLIERIN